MILIISIGDKKIQRTAIKEGDDYKEGSRNATRTKTGKMKEIVVEDGNEEDEIEEEITIVTKKVVKKGKPKNKTIVSLRLRKCVFFFVNISLFSYLKDCFG